MTENQKGTGSNHSELKLFWLALGYEIFLLLGVGFVSWKLWNKPDPIIMYVPVYVLEWGAIGGAANVLYKLLSKPDRERLLDLPVLAVVKPVVGAVFGAVAFFAAQIGLLIISKSTAGNTNNELLSLVAFVGGFSDRFTLDVIDRLIIKGGIKGGSPEQRPD